jgi:hypothetical protein
MKIYTAINIRHTSGWHIHNMGSNLTLKIAYIFRSAVDSKQ